MKDLFRSQGKVTRVGNQSMGPGTVSSSVFGEADRLRGMEPRNTPCLVGGAVAQQVPVQAIQVHQAPQQASPSRDSSTDLTQTSSSGTGMTPCHPPRLAFPQEAWQKVLSSVAPVPRTLGN